MVATGNIKAQLALMATETEEMRALNYKELKKLPKLASVYLLLRCY